MIIYEDLLREIASEDKHTFISTGMAKIEDIDKAVEIFREKKCPFELMHTVSTYPMKDSDANLNMIDTLKKRYSCNVGYSGHESGVIVSCAAVAIGASSLERHITLDRAMYGSDQSASLEVGGFKRLVSYVRDITISMGTPEKTVTDKEREIASKLRKVDTL